MDTVKIRFNTTRVVADEHEGTSRETRFEAGATYSLEPRSADRWVKRGVAEFVTTADAEKAEGASALPAVKLLDPARQSDGKKDPSPTEVKDAENAGQQSETGASDGKTALVDIPEDWKSLHHATKKKLARDISGAEAADTDAAEVVIEAELARRAAEQAGE